MGKEQSKQQQFEPQPQCFQNLTFDDALFHLNTYADTRKIIKGECQPIKHDEKNVQSCNFKLRNAPESSKRSSILTIFDDQLPYKGENQRDLRKGHHYFDIHIIDQSVSPYIEETYMY